MNVQHISDSVVTANFCVTYKCLIIINIIILSFISKQHVMCQTSVLRKQIAGNCYCSSYVTIEIQFTSSTKGL